MTINGSDLPRELWLPIYKELDPRTQGALEVTTIATLIPSEEREVMKAIVKRNLFNSAWEQETNPEIKQKITEYRRNLEGAIRKYIRHEKEIESLNQAYDETEKAQLELRKTLKSARTSTLWGRIRTYICQPGTFLDKTVRKVLRIFLFIRLFKSVRDSLENEEKLERAIAEKEKFKTGLLEPRQKAYNGRSESSAEIARLKRNFDRNVLEQKKMWDLFGGRDKFLQLPVIQLPEGQTNFFDGRTGELNIKPEDMGDNAIMRGTEPNGTEFFVLRAKIVQYKDGTRFYGPHIHMQIIRFPKSYYEWQPMGDWDQVIQATGSDALARQDRRDSLRDLIEKKEYRYDDYGYETASGEKGIGIAMRLKGKLPETYKYNLQKKSASLV